MKQIFLLAAVILMISTAVTADTITLKDGQTFTGKLIQRTDTAVLFEIGGQQMNFPLTNVRNVSVDFNAATPATEPAAPAAPATAPAPAPKAPQIVEVPAGTPMTVTLKTPLDTGRHSAGHRFTGTLEGNLTSGGTVVAPRGTTVYGRVVSANKSGRVVGQAAMDITFTDLLINNQMVPVSTSTISTTTGRTGAKTARTTAAGAAIGGLAGGSSGARTGAKVGLGASVLTRGNQVQIPAGTMFDVSLRAPLIMK